ncbi:anti-CBASS protein Acb1 family protein [Aureimonas sp. N4]|uniref:anti-CBASS protein Acb1 family protein n=1 Tax=Aureimonas sp. N4 TaxID=1638165 RepID=UPI000780E878|nr:anti-CBASS Acb1 family protein [Aureimonas sp. N4]
MTALRLVVNEATRSLGRMFPGFFPGMVKHDHNKDFGYPDTLTFDLLYRMYRRNGIASAGVNKTILKTWQQSPWLLEKERDGSEGGTKKETPLERDIRQRFEDLRVWQNLAEADRRSLVGRYAGVVLRLADGQMFDQPVGRVPGGLDGILELIPAWEGQLEVAEWDQDQRSPTYGEPTMYQFTEAAVGDSKVKRLARIHPDRVIVWSADGTLNGESYLAPGYNDLMTLEKVSGAGGEGFWKNAKSAPVLEVDKEAQITQMAAAMGVQPSEIADAMNEQVEAYQKGFDNLLMLQGIQAKTLSVNLPSPEHFFAVALQSFAASIMMPVKILVGNQTGERASSEDAADWAQTIMSRRATVVIPNIMELVNRLERFGILPEKDWFLDWQDLTEASMAEKIERASKMADVNQKMSGSGEIIFTGDEIREAVDLEPLSDADKFRDEGEDDPTAALPPDPQSDTRPPAE